MKKVGLLVILAAMLLVVFVGCGQASEPTGPSETVSQTGDETPSDADEAQSVLIQAAGSTSVGPLLETLAGKYVEANTNVKINVEQIDSGAGVTACGDGTADIGMASRDLKDEEKANYPDMVATTLCLDGVVVVVNADNPVGELTTEQVKKIFLGEITDWSQVGGNEGRIQLYTREGTSGTREAFQSLFLGKDADGNKLEIEDTMCVIQSSNGAMGTAIEGDVSGIGYMSLGIAPNYKVTAVAIDGVAATVENLIAGTYNYARPFNLLTLGEPAGEAAAFIEYCMTDADAVAYMEEKGYVLP